MLSKSISCGLFVLFSLVASSADAGPLLDWLRSKCNRYNGNVPTGTLQATSGTFTQAPTTLLPGQCQRTCMQTCQRTVVNYVPYTAYRTDWKRVPVTQYRPVTNTDPCSGCTVTCMRPCTSYSWQLQRTPYTTYRPVYQTQNYKVPVTTISNDCATGGCSTCSTCGVPPAGATGVLPQAVPNGTGGFLPANPNAVPADTVPSLSMNRPTYGIYDSYATPENYQAYSVSPNYAAPQAYSGMTQYSGYGNTNLYAQPMPSSYEAPQPGVSESYGAPSVPADQKPMLLDSENSGAGLQQTQGSTLPNSGVQSVLTNTLEAQPLNDPSPDQRWDFNVPQLGRPEDQSAHHAVQVRWAYTLTNGANYSDSIPVATAGNASIASPMNSVNDLWQSGADSNRSTEINSDWN